MAYRRILLSLPVSLAVSCLTAMSAMAQAGYLAPPPGYALAPAASPPGYAPPQQRGPSYPPAPAASYGQPYQPGYVPAPTGARLTPPQNPAPSLPYQGTPQRIMPLNQPSPPYQAGSPVTGVTVAPPSGMPLGTPYRAGVPASMPFEREQRPAAQPGTSQSAPLAEVTPEEMPQLPAFDDAVRVAKLRVLNKVTAKVEALEGAVGEPLIFANLEILPRACMAPMPGASPNQTAVPEAGLLTISETKPGQEKKEIFSGWMFVASPSLNALAHPVYDVTLAGCERGKSDATPEIAAPDKNEKTPETSTTPLQLDDEPAD